MKKILIPISVLFAAGLSQAQLTNTENYVYSKTYLDYNGTTATKTSETVQYIDGLGRPKQVVNVKVTPQGKDIVIPIIYDSFGRQTRDYLPIPQNATTNGQVYTQSTDLVPYPIQDITGFYSGEKIYSEKIIENSPLDRVQQQIQVGTAWSNKPVKFDYDANIAGEVIKYTTTTTWENGATKSMLTQGGTYGTAQLYKNTVTDEDGDKTIEFKNGEGQTLLVRKAISDTENADTYYVYNEYNQLTYVIPPNAAVVYKNLGTGTAIAYDDINLNNLCYRYRYDGRNRLVEKKLPGKGWEHMVYDKGDRLIMTQDANLRPDKRWLFTKYDKFSRAIYTGITADPNGRSIIQGYVDYNFPNNNEGSGSFTQNGLTVQYTNSNAFPTYIYQLLSVNYYDTYPAGSPAIPTLILEQEVLSQDAQNSNISTKSLPVASYVKNIEDDNWTKNYIWYDKKGRTIGTYSINHLGGFTKTESKLDFAGVPQKTNTYHLRKQGEFGITLKERFVYDNQNRLFQHYHQVDNKPEELLVENQYNELSQLKNKKVGNNLQSIDYAYNIRGWMTEINKDQMNLADLGGKLFSYKIKYNQRDGIENPDTTQFAGKNVTKKYNGNIAETDWRSVETLGVNPPITPKRYGYAYDKLNRLTAGYYQNPLNPYSKENTESLSYDLNGNILGLYRTSVLEYGNTSATLIDNLDYIYSGGDNKVTNINDYAYNDTGYEGGGNTIGYDVNGNMTGMPDKGISLITYNYLNLPNQLKMQASFENVTIKTKYRADGTKLRKENTTITSGFNGDTTQIKTSDYLDVFQYLQSVNQTSVVLQPEIMSRRAMEPQAFTIAQPRTVLTIKTPDLEFFPTTEGFYDYKKDQYIYQYRDHLGNARVSFGRNSAGALEITDANDYYPFGMNHLKTGNAFFGAGSYKNYKYQGQELQETGFYSFKWRNYMSDVGRFFNIDPLAEKYPTWTPYAFSGNRVIDARELEGLEPVDFRKNDGYKNLVVVVQGWSGDTKPNKTQAQNVRGSNNPYYKGKGNLDLTGIGGLVGLANSNTRVVVFDSSQNENTKNDLKTTISNFNDVHSDGTVAAVGHSLGADNIVESVNESKDLKVDLIVTLDIMDTYSDTTIKSPNVSKVVNYSQTKDVYGGENVTASKDNKTTKIINVTAPNSTHKSIDNDLRDRVRENVQRELQP